MICAWAAPEAAIMPMAAKPSASRENFSLNMLSLLLSVLWTAGEAPANSPITRSVNARSVETGPHPGNRVSPMPHCRKRPVIPADGSII
ncbi:MAG: hypothetical protein MO853_03425 [Candidatus Protistobacter heckmanni]|nr:hypothetical protein [Candidatus Protistobacter heckmanni]